MYYKIPEKIYPLDIYFMDFDTARKRKFNPKGKGHTFYSEVEGWIVFAIDLDKYDLTTLTHECLHICIFIFECIGLEVTRSTDEAFCYLHDFLLKSVYNRVQKELNKGENK